jgi:hypothetical protein
LADWGEARPGVGLARWRGRGQEPCEQASPASSAASPVPPYLCRRSWALL